jgi:hypothetical protein
MASVRANAAINPTLAASETYDTFNEKTEKIGDLPAAHHQGDRLAPGGDLGHLEGAGAADHQPDANPAASQFRRETGSASILRPGRGSFAYLRTRFVILVLT